MINSTVDDTLVKPENKTATKFQYNIQKLKSTIEICRGMVSSGLVDYQSDTQRR